MQVRAKTVALLAEAAARVPSPAYRARLVRRVMELDPNAVLQGVGPTLSRSPTLEAAPLDLEPEGSLEFEDLAGLFASTSLNHGVVGMTIRQLAYVFGTARRLPAKRAIEVGRWRGGSTIAIAAGMGPGGKLWSIDVGEKEARLFGGDRTSFDGQTQRFVDRFGLDVELLVGDSRTLEVDTGEVDLVLIDGDHTYEGVRNDFERFGRRVRVGGAVLLDDAFPEDHFETHVESVGRLVREVIADGDYRLVKSVDRLAHLARTR